MRVRKNKRAFDTARPYGICANFRSGTRQNLSAVDFFLGLKCGL